MVNLSLELEPNPEGKYIYRPGDVLKGVAGLSLKTEKKINGFFVIVYGAASAHWSESEGRYTVDFKGKDIYLNSVTHFIGGNQNLLIKVPPGLHTYTFSVQLPDNLPTSLKIQYGEIKYYVKIILRVPWSSDAFIKTPIFVDRNDNLNLYPELRLPQKHRGAKVFMHLFSDSEPFYMSAEIPYSGYAVGQDVHVKINYVNKSDVSIMRTKVILEQLIKFKSKTPEIKEKLEKQRISWVYCPGVNKKSSKDVEGILKIPDVPYSNGRFCEVIVINYFIKIKGEVSIFHNTPKIAFPITIGSIPIRNEALPNDESTGHLDPSSDDMLPPSYEESLKMICQ